MIKGPLAAQTKTLHKGLNGFHLWGLAVGLVISGEYFGWSYGWSSAGTLGFLVATVVVALMYTAFIFSFTELTTSIPNAGGPFAYAHRAFGKDVAFFAGAATLIEFVFAPPAIALAIGAYLAVQFPGLNPKLAAVGAYAVFVTLNIAGVTIAANVELVVTVLAILELLVFMGVLAPGFSWTRFAAHGWAGSETLDRTIFGGVFSSIPFAIWFFLAIEGVAMAAEEVSDPKVIPIAYIAGILTLLALAFGVMIFAGGVGDWRTISNINDPLPQAMKIVVGSNSTWLHMLIWLGLFGLVASFHGIILGYSRQMFALGRARYLPALLARLHPRFGTPYVAIGAGAIVGVGAIYGDSLFSVQGQSLTATIVTLSVFGALSAYVISMASLFKLRVSEPLLPRPYRAPFFPWTPAVAMTLASGALVAMCVLNVQIFLVYGVLMGGGFGLFWIFGRRSSIAPSAAGG